MEIKKNTIRQKHNASMPHWHTINRVTCRNSSAHTQSRDATLPPEHVHNTFTIRIRTCTLASVCGTPCAVDHAEKGLAATHHKSVCTIRARALSRHPHKTIHLFSHSSGRAGACARAAMDMLCTISQMFRCMRSIVN